MIGEGICSLWIETPSIAEEAVPGQFVSLYCRDGSRLLPRPISLCEIDRAGKRLHMVYRIAGKGTAEFAALKAGDTIEVMGPLGNGFPLEKAAGRRVFLMGGGIGIPPMLETAKALTGNSGYQNETAAKVTAVLGYRDERFLQDEYEKICDVCISTEDGSYGTKGNVIDAIRENALEADVIFACGPAPMLRGIKAYAQEKGIACWISMEERMACGIGACLACVCQSKEVDGHSHVHNKRICKDGPVFEASEVEL
ncbi:MAG: dihydroorotate dehydrogenase electron transfer subunit [Lachnospiraceae bacterium]|nr:dihydroorotate dehydrogenase electron transfer subunit [Lachnospiraceae bacterium]